MWGATSIAKQRADADTVSIHAPRVGCDYGEISVRRDFGVSIHAPRVGCDAVSIEGFLWMPMFQFTHPVWGATTNLRRYIRGRAFQFTHPVWGATLDNQEPKNVG